MEAPRGITLLLSCAVIVGVITLIYAPGLNGGFQFDDFQIIVSNPSLELRDTSTAAILDAALSTNTGPLKRPLAMLSFAANRTIFGPEAASFKIVNLAIHALNALLIVALMRRVLPFIEQTPRSGGTWLPLRSEERRVGKECRSRWSREHYKKKG